MQHIDHKRTVVKLGGSMLSGLSDVFFTKFIQMQREGHELVIVHGGGPFINSALIEKGIESHIDEGIRVTCEKSMEIVKSVLIGEVNTSLVHQLNDKGIKAIGLNGFDGNLLPCTVLNEERFGFVGKITKVNEEVLDSLLGAGLVPVVSCIGSTQCGTALNINADTVASEIALALRANSLILVTDTPGIQVGNEMQQNASPASIEQWIEEGEIYEGMIPKVNAALACLHAGIPQVHIADQHLNGTVIGFEEALI